MFQLIYKCTNKIKDKVAALSAKLNEKGQGMVEYAMILAAVAIIAVVVLWNNGEGSLISSISKAFTTASTKINAASTQANPTLPASGGTGGGSN